MGGKPWDKKFAHACPGVMAQWLERLPHNRKVVGSSPGRVIPKTLKMVLTAFLSGARHMRKEWEVKHAELPVDQPPAVAFTAFADVWPRGIETEIGVALSAIGAGRTLTF